MTDTPMPPPMPPTSDVSRPNARRLGTIVVGIAVLCLVVFFYLDSRDAQDQLSSQVQQNADLQKQLENLAETVSEIKTSKLYRQEEQTIARDDSLSALQMGKLAEDRITELRQSAAGWQVTRNKYLQSTEGRRIASDPQLTEQVQTLLKSDIPTPEHADQLNERLQNLLQTVRDAVESKSTTFKPADSLPRINEIEKQATEKLAAVGQALRNLTAIGKQAAALPPNQDHSLESAIANLEDSRAKDQRARVTEAVAAARRESDEKLARASAESERKIADAKAQAEKLVGEETATKIVADAKRQQQQLAQERKKKEDEAREAVLEKEYEKDLPQIRQYLSAFITPGFAHRDKRAPKGPVSFAWIDGQNALEDSRQGMERIMWIATVQNDRPRGAMPSFIGGENGWKFTAKEPIQKAQELLRKYGNLMVKKGLLAE